MIEKYTKAEVQRRVMEMVRQATAEAESNLRHEICSGYTSGSVSSAYAVFLDALTIEVLHMKYSNGGN